MSSIPPANSLENGSDAFYRESESFLTDLNDRLSRILKIGATPLGGQRFRDHFVIGSSVADLGPGLSLTNRGVHTLYLDISIKCTVDRERAFVAVEKSSFKIKSPKGKNPRPLVSFDYHRSPSADTIPVSHLNLHSHNRLFDAALRATAGSRYRTKRRASDLKKGKLPQMASLHFPTGGHRFRPCVEDVLEFLIVEFGVDSQKNWEGVVHEGRLSWKRIQAKSVVRDDPESAADALERCGYSITKPSQPRLPQEDRLSRY